MKTSKEGTRFILATFLTALAAFNTGNNLIYLIFSMMLSILVISVVILRVNLTGLKLRASPEYPIFAKSPAALSITLMNAKRRLTSYSVKVVMPEAVQGTAYFESIPAHEERTQTLRVVYKKRGVYGCGDIFIESSFPFIFLSQRINSRIPQEVIIYPEIKEVGSSIEEMTKEEYAVSSSSRKRGDEFSALREFRYGDDRRKIHWKASAKTAHLMVTEYAAEETKKLTVILDNLMPSDDTAFENAVSLAASLSDRFLREGFYVRLFTCRKVVPFGGGGQHLYKILDILAAIKGEPSLECPLSSEAGAEGVVILILGSEFSPLTRFVSVSDKVYYASEL
jgi:uncharacterized protein (DUF58 family)